jgi:hypothetical protein
MSLPIPQELIEQLKKGNVVLFCGAGISMSEGGLPSGGQLARELAKRAGRPAMANAPLPEVAQAYELEMGHQSLIEYIAGRIDDPPRIPLRTHRLIVVLPFTKIVTTNWDNLLEKTMDQAGKPFVKIVRDSEVAYADEAKVLLVKLHGSIEQKDSIIITGDDYYDVFARLSETANLVRAYFATRTILFLGFGLADEDFKRLYHGVVRRIGVHKRRAYAVQLNPDKLTVKHWAQKNVQIVAADATVFLEALADALKRDIVPIPPPFEPTPFEPYPAHEKLSLGTEVAKTEEGPEWVRGEKRMSDEQLSLLDDSDYEEIAKEIAEERKKKELEASQEYTAIVTKEPEIMDDSDYREIAEEITEEMKEPDERLLSSEQPRPLGDSNYREIADGIADETKEPDERLPNSPRSNSQTARSSVIKEWLIARSSGVLDEIIAGLIMTSILYVFGVVSGVLEGTPVAWLANSGSTWYLAGSIALMGMALIAYVAWRRKRR